MARVPTYKIRNLDNGETRIVNQCDYDSGYRTSHGRFKSVMCGGRWEIVTENHAGGDAGYQESKKQLDQMVALEKKNQANPSRFKYRK
jgi:hypothetical protein